MSSDPKQAVNQAGLLMRKAVESAFKKSVGNVELVAKQLAPVGHTGRRRGFAGRAGGTLQNSLKTQVTSLNGVVLSGRAFSAIVYATRQHDESYHHPGKYTGAPGPRFAAKFFQRAAEICFNGKDPANDIGGQLRRQPVPPPFAEILDDEVQRLNK